MSAESVLDEALAILLAKARNRTDAQDIQTAQPSALVINFDGVGLPLTAGSAGLYEIRFPCRILACHMFAGVFDPVSLLPVPTAATASVELRLAQQGLWSAGSAPLYGTGVRPSMTAIAEAEPSIASWTLDLQPGDLIVYALSAFVGVATFLTLSLPVRRLDVTGIGVSSWTDADGVAFTDAGGEPFVIRG